MVIRKMKIEDYDNVYDLWMSCVGMGLNNLDDSKEGVDKFIQRNPDSQPSISWLPLRRLPQR